MLGTVILICEGMDLRRRERVTRSQQLGWLGG